MGSRSVAFGWLALVRGLGLLIAGAALGFAYEISLATVVVVIVLANAVAMASLISVLRRLRPASSTSL